MGLASNEFHKAGFPALLFKKDRQANDPDGSVELSRWLYRRLKAKSRPINVVTLEGQHKPRCLKDPCIVETNTGDFSLYSTAYESPTNGLGVIRAKARSIFDSFVLQGKTGWLDPAYPSSMDIREACAPGALFNSATGETEMVMQTTFTKSGGSINVLADDGRRTRVLATILEASDTEDLRYDPHPFKDDAGHMGIVYSGGKDTRSGEIYTAFSRGGIESWRINPYPIITPKSLMIHDDKADTAEWRPEGPTIFQLPSGIWASANVIFVENGRFGATESQDKYTGYRQRFEFSFGYDAYRPFVSLPIPFWHPKLDWRRDLTEYGHPAPVTDRNRQLKIFGRDTVALTIQDYEKQTDRWGISLLTMSLKELENMGKNMLEGKSLPVPT